MKICWICLVWSLTLYQGTCLTIQKSPVLACSGLWNWLCQPVQLSKLWDSPPLWSHQSPVNEKNSNFISTNTQTCSCVFSRGLVPDPRSQKLPVLCKSSQFCINSFDSLCSYWIIRLLFVFILIEWICVRAPKPHKKSPTKMNANVFSPCFEGGPSAAGHPVSFSGPAGFAHHYFCRPLSSASVYGHTQQQLAIDIPPLASVDSGDHMTQGFFECHFFIYTSCWKRYSHILLCALCH